MLAGAVEQCCPVIHQSPGRAQHLVGWTDVEIAFLIVGEVFAGGRLTIGDKKEIDKATGASRVAFA